MAKAKETNGSTGNGVKKAAKKKPGPKVPCIAQGCRKDSKGPRFHYLCEAHKDAKAKQVHEWQARVTVNRKTGTKTTQKVA